MILTLGGTLSAHMKAFHLNYIWIFMHWLMCTVLIFRYIVKSMIPYDFFNIHTLILPFLYLFPSPFSSQTSHFNHPPVADHFHLLSFLCGSPIDSLPLLPSLFLQLFQAMYLILRPKARTLTLLFIQYQNIIEF